MKIFISSVRRGLEEERDALPGLIMALGHTPLRFEDFGAQTVPSRETCLEGMASADAYLLLLGPKYGHRFSDTGQSPTHDEWVAATTAGLPRLVYRKNGVMFEPDQLAFVRLVGDYTSGVFYDTFTSTAELLTKVAGKLRGIEQAAQTVSFARLDVPISITWRSQFRASQDQSALFGAVVEVHVVPVPAQPRPARVLSELAEWLPRRMREVDTVSPEERLMVARDVNGVCVLAEHNRQAGWNEARKPKVLGVRVGREGQTSVWSSLPADGLGSVIDPENFPDQLAGMLRLLGGLKIVESEQVAVAIGVDPSRTVSVDSVARLPRQSGRMSMSDDPIRVEPDEVVSLAALDVGAREVGRAFSQILVERLSVRW